MLSFTEPAATVAEADAYVAARLYPGWTGTDEVKAAAILRGQMYIAGTYNARWTVEFDNDEAPENVRFAIIEAAHRELTAPGSLAPDFSPLESVKRIRKKVGDLEKETEYRDGTAANAAPVFSVIDGLLAGLIGLPSGASVDLMRV